MTSRTLTGIQNATRILQELKARGPQTAAQLAQILKLSTTSTALYLRNLHAREEVRVAGWKPDALRVWAVADRPPEPKALPAILPGGKSGGIDVEHLAWMAYWRRHQAIRLANKQPAPTGQETAP